MTDPSPSPAVVFRHPSDGTVWRATGGNIDRLRRWGWAEDKTTRPKPKPRQRRRTPKPPTS